MGKGVWGGSTVNKGILRLQHYAVDSLGAQFFNIALISDLMRTCLEPHFDLFTVCRCVLQQGKLQQ